MLVVSNTSPLSNLAIIGRLELLRDQLGVICIPPAVHTELGHLPMPQAREALGAAFRTGWLQVRPLAKAVPAGLVVLLDNGEAEALSLALEQKADLVLLDESAARANALQLGLAHTGVLGILRHARLKGSIPSLQTEILRLRSEARFFISPILEKQLLRSVGEV
jgi:hypothetical protein